MAVPAAFIGVGICITVIIVCLRKKRRLARESQQTSQSPTAGHVRNRTTESAVSFTRTAANNVNEDVAVTLADPPSYEEAMITYNSTQLPTYNQWLTKTYAGQD